MTAAAITVTRPTDVRGCAIGNKKAVFRDITADTGTYTTGGFTLTAVQLGLGHHVDLCVVGSLATTGTAGVTASAVGVTYVSGGTSVVFQVYESGASGAAFIEKTSNEAYETNFTFRVMCIGY